MSEIPYLLNAILDGIDVLQSLPSLHLSSLQVPSQLQVPRSELQIQLQNFCLEGCQHGSQTVKAAAFGQMTAQTSNSCKLLPHFCAILAYQESKNG